MAKACLVDRQFTPHKRDCHYDDREKQPFQRSTLPAGRGEAPPTLLSKQSVLNQVVAACVNVLIVTRRQREQQKPWTELKAVFTILTAKCLNQCPQDTHGAYCFLTA